MLKTVKTLILTIAVLTMCSVVFADGVKKQGQPIITDAHRVTMVENLNLRDAPPVLISEYCDYQPAGYADARFLEIYNPTDTPFYLGTADVDTNLYIAKYSNGATSSYSTALFGTIAPNDVFVIAGNQDKFVEIFGFEADQYSSNISGNGDDVFVLSTSGYPADATPNVFDILGEIGVDGTGTAWDHLDQTIMRNSDILVPNSVWTASEWTLGAGDETFATPGWHIDEAVVVSTFPYNEGFEIWAPTDWAIDPTTGANTWVQDDGSDHGPSSIYEGTYAAMFNNYDISSGGQASMTTPQLDLSGLSVPRFSFYWWNDDGSYNPATLAISSSTDGATFTTIETIDTYGSGADTWVEVRYSIATDVKFVRLTATSDYGIKNTFVDDVTNAER
jgi:hypothetical protein